MYFELLYSSFSFEINDLNTYYLEDGKLVYTINAKNHIERLKKDDIIFLFFNPKDYMLKNNYYSKGIFKYKHLTLKFTKAYKYNNKVFMFNVKGTTKEGNIIAKEAIFNTNVILLKKCEYTTSSKFYRRREFFLKIN